MDVIISLRARHLDNPKCLSAYKLCLQKAIAIVHWVLHFRSWARQCTYHGDLNLAVDDEGVAFGRYGRRARSGVNC